MDGSSVSGGSNLTLTLAERACAVTYDGLPEPVRELTRQCLLDYLAVGDVGTVMLHGASAFRVKRCRRKPVR